MCHNCTRPPWEHREQLIRTRVPPSQGALQDPDGSARNLPHRLAAWQVSWQRKRVSMAQKRRPVRQLIRTAATVAPVQDPPPSAEVLQTDSVTISVPAPRAVD